MSLDCVPSFISSYISPIGFGFSNAVASPKIVRISVEPLMFMGTKFQIEGYVTPYLTLTRNLFNFGRPVLRAPNHISSLAIRLRIVSCENRQLPPFDG